MTDDEFGMLVREAILLLLDAVERKFDVSPTTAKIRERSKLLEKSFVHKNNLETRCRMLENGAKEIEKACQYKDGI